MNDGAPARGSFDAALCECSASRAAASARKMTWCGFIQIGRSGEAVRQSLIAAVARRRDETLCSADKMNRKVGIEST